MTTTTKVFHWIPRIIGILMTLFIGMFALDAFDPRLSVMQQIMDFLVHLIPAYIALATVLIGWKWDLAGCLIYLVLALIYTFWAFHHPLWILCISVPLLVLSVLFFISWYLKAHGNKKVALS
jgi:cell division protein FtsW (lipid II flippase)